MNLVNPLGVTRENVMSVEIEILQLDFDFFVDKDHWHAESFWRWPTNEHEMANLAMSVRMAFERESQALLVLSAITRFKVNGQRYTLNGPLASRMIHHMDNAVLGNSTVFNLRPVVEGRYVLGEGVNLGQN